MAERVYPQEHDTDGSESYTHHEHKMTFDSSEHPINPRFDSAEHPIPPSRRQAAHPPSYVVQIPKDQIYRVPAPSNDRKYKKLSRPKKKCNFCACFCWFVFVIVGLALILALIGGIIYLVYRPTSPSYSIDSVVVKGFNLTTPDPFSPEFDVGVIARNPNGKVSISYESGSSVSILNSGQVIVTGNFPVFFQEAQNVTVAQTNMTASGIRLSNTVHQALSDGQNQNQVPLVLQIYAPVKMRLGTVSTWTFIINVNCNIAVDNLTEKAKVVSNSCSFSVKVFKFM